MWNWGWEVGREELHWREKEAGGSNKWAQQGSCSLNRIAVSGLHQVGVSFFAHFSTEYYSELIQGGCNRKYGIQNNQHCLFTTKPSAQAARQGTRAACTLDGVKLVHLRVGQASACIAT